MRTFASIRCTQALKFPIRTVSEDRKWLTAATQQAGVVTEVVQSRAYVTVLQCTYRAVIKAVGTVLVVEVFSGPLQRYKGPGLSLWDFQAIWLRQLLEKGDHGCHWGNLSPNARCRACPAGLVSERFLYNSIFDKARDVCSTCQSLRYEHVRAAVNVKHCRKLWMSRACK